MLDGSPHLTGSAACRQKNMALKERTWRTWEWLLPGLLAAITQCGSSSRFITTGSMDLNTYYISWGCGGSRLRWWCNSPMIVFSREPTMPTVSICSSPWYPAAMRSTGGFAVNKIIQLREDKEHKAQEPQPKEEMSHKGKFYCQVPCHTSAQHGGNISLKSHQLGSGCSWANPHYGVHQWRAQTVLQGGDGCSSPWPSHPEYWEMCQAGICNSNAMIWITLFNLGDQSSSICIWRSE